MANYQTSPYGAYLKQRDAENRRGFLKGVVLPVAAAGGGGALAGLMGGAGSGLAGTVINGAPISTTFGSSLPAMAAGGGYGGGLAAKAATSRMAGLLGGPAANLGVNAALSLFGLRSQNNAAKRAEAAAAQSMAEQLALQRQQLEIAQRNADLDRADAKAANDAANELKRRELSASEEERAYRRRLEDERNARLDPYRQMSREALSRLMPLLGF